MKRELALKVLLGFIGLALVAGSYPLLSALFNLDHTDIIRGDQMILGIYLPIGIFLLLAIRNPAANRTLILAFAWSCIAHVAVMVWQDLHDRSIGGDIPPFAIIFLLSVALLALAPRNARVPERG